MEVGDLVKFESGIKAWERDYKERIPGLIVGTHSGHNFTGIVTQSMTILWADASITSEHEGYLKILSKI